jgi:sn-glycerol 3-phosphate transport system permease protein
MTSRDRLHGWLLLLPAMALLALFTHWPALATLHRQLLLDAAPRRPARFVGLDNYRSMATTRCSGRRSGTTSGSRSARFRSRSRSRSLMALWVNDRIAGRGFLRMAYFTPTVLPMIAVANIWLFFYTPQYGLLEQIAGALGGRPQLARLARHRARA